ncbi:MAG TPA: ATP-binding protein [Pseudonocardia sp.]|uniref:sensor histidine kinase n=1 Tax=Pseudonocardia sp. TaxID=60912 RepID=UPI002B7047DF|nr:ATP-binding protein [Pseudonocardia sp.]HTF50174.1 ATP-binding protein [Pseudonocardia sp.]
MKTPAFLAGWWARRSLRVRITVAVGGVAVFALGALAWLATGLVGITITGAVDVELARAAANATGQLSAGVPEDSVVPADDSVDGVSERIAIRVADTAGRPLDGGMPLPLDTAMVRRLAAGEAVTVNESEGPTRWLGVVAIAPNGSPRLVLAAAHLVGYTAVLRRGAFGLGLAALLAGIGVALAAWTAVGLALRPVDRMRAAAVSLPPGKRLPLPPAEDELHALAEELNELLARRDNASARLERFTGDAAHELRSPVAAIRAQAEVAVVHPDPALAEETLRSVATEAARLSELLSDLLALARADAGARPPATAVDMVSEARKAIARAELAAEADHPPALHAANGNGRPSIGSFSEAEPEPSGALAEAEPVGSFTEAEPVGSMSEAEPAGVMAEAEPAGVMTEAESGCSAPMKAPAAITLTAPVRVLAAASPGEVALVLDNLLGNARRYARSRVWVSVLPAGRSVRLVVDDDGPGVPEEDRRRVFDRFTRLEADRGGVSGGAGLGLALVMALLSGRGGTVRMTASPDGGARVEARWPAAAPVDRA